MRVFLLEGIFGQKKKKLTKMGLNRLVSNVLFQSSINQGVLECDNIIFEMTLLNIIHRYFRRCPKNNENENEQTTEILIAGSSVHTRG